MSERLAMIQLKALKRLGEHLGMWGRIRMNKEDDNEMASVCYTAYKLTKSRTAKLALSMLLDYYKPNWREYVPEEELGAILERSSKEVTKWKREVLKRDNYTCVCGEKNHLHVHHILHWADFPEARVNIDNGITLCADCHAKEHEDISRFILSKKEGVFV